MKAKKSASAHLRVFEKLGAFYLGGLCDAEGKLRTDEPLLYDAKDLTTHAVCVGMTGSGKTGLCVALIEEAAIDGIPAIIVDPKGDLGNLALTFPRLAAKDFLPWVDPAEAANKGQTDLQLAEKTAALWRKGLASWGQDGKRVARFRDAAELAIYTPGSHSGLPLTILRSFDVPSTELLQDADALRAHLSGTVSGLLGLLGIEADPVRSREQVLLSTILTNAWEQNRALDLAGLIREIQNPPFEKIGVLDLESVFPGKERFELAMRVNNLLASPGFSAWLEGEALDIRRLLWNETGKPKISIVSIAHLDDAQRMFVVTSLANALIAWMRSQPGTPSLRALFYMDEVYGYLPPSAKPPSKPPLLTLLKQARAFGLGLVLATQNPVDLDYKALSNAGTWLLGRLQTERDKLRVLDGLEGASVSSGAQFDRARIERLLSGLGKRVFLMNNVHEAEPVLFHTRWVLSYLRGPLTRQQIKRLMEPVKRRRGAREGTSARKRRSGTSRRGAPAASASPRVALPSGIEELFGSEDAGTASSEATIYEPFLLARAELHYTHARSATDKWLCLECLVPLMDNTAMDPWKAARWIEEGEISLSSSPVAEASFLPLPARALRKASYKGWERSLKTHLYREKPLVLFASKKLKLMSSDGESEAAFQIRFREALRERRDLELAKLRRRFAPKLARLQERIQVALRRVERERSQYSHQKLQTAISLGATVLGALLGRRASTVGRAATTFKGASRAARERGDIGQAKAQVEQLRDKFSELEAEFTEALEGRREAFDPALWPTEHVVVRLRKADSTVSCAAIVWLVRA